MSAMRRRRKKFLRRMWVDRLFCRHNGHEVDTDPSVDWCLRCEDILEDES